jgi:hypothetical protein
LGDIWRIRVWIWSRNVVNIVVACERAENFGIAVVLSLAAGSIVKAPVASENLEMATFAKA